VLKQPDAAVHHCHVQCMSYGHQIAAGTSQNDEDEDEDIALQSGVQALNHKRGMAPYVFVPWHDVTTSQLNLPVEQMDMYIPG